MRPDKATDRHVSNLIVDRKLGFLSWHFAKLLHLPTIPHVYRDDECFVRITDLGLILSMARHTEPKGPDWRTDADVIFEIEAWVEERLRESDGTNDELLL